ncbi:MAG: proton-conducting transporter membrane subunit [Saprospiraceae bacterium]
MISQILLSLVLLPLVALFILLFIESKRERLISNLVLISTSAGLLMSLLAFLYWMLGEGKPIYHKVGSIYSHHDFDFIFGFYYDLNSGVFQLLGALLFFVVALFSKFYMHREEGFKRYFFAFLFFMTGYNIAVLSGNFESFFVGWEIIGISSFLLIAFYRDRILPVRNGFKVLSFYRLGDIFLIMALFLCHHLWHRNIQFDELTQENIVGSLSSSQESLLLWLSLFIVLAALIKSAQFPFSSWLPRAMEGPSSSSSIFYGSLAVHLGIFLLLRTFPLWSHDYFIRGLLVAVGLISAISGTLISRVQSGVKSQLAYSTVVQIGFMLMELGFGLNGFVLFHVVGHSFLRAYQFLVSPSVLSYLSHHMIFHFKPRVKVLRSNFLERIHSAIYLFSIKEFGLDYFMYRFLWTPFKRLGTFIQLKFQFLSISVLVLFCSLIMLRNFVSQSYVLMIDHQLPLWSAGVGLIIVLTAFSSAGRPLDQWLKICLSQVFTVFALSYNKPLGLTQLFLYLAGLMLAGTLGYVCLVRVERKEKSLGMNKYHGHVYEYRKHALFFLLACLGFAGFPITTTFIGIDLFLTYIHYHEWLMLTFLCLNYLFLELALIRIYIRVFLGPHIKQYHPIAFRAS